MTRIAVVDVETTGLNPYRHDRVVELAAVVIREDGTVEREFATLINPERDMGPSRIHGLTAGDVLGAPRFSEIAGMLTEFLGGSVALAGHNVRFDLSFLTAEFERTGYRLPELASLCTMHLAGGGSLVQACSDYGVAFDGEAHAALHDARAAAQLLAVLLRDAPLLAAETFRSHPIAWPRIPKVPVNLVTRAEARRRQAEPPAYLDRLLTRRQPDLPPGHEEANAELAYTGLLDRVLADRHVDAEEGRALLEVATRWAMSGDQVRRVHREYLVRLAEAALADGTVTETERRDLLQVGQLLGLDAAELDSVLADAPHRSPCVQSPDSGMQGGGGLAGKHVCFTGEGQCRLNGAWITREMAARLATKAGLVVTESVTKKLDLLVVADPLTQSGKARKARQYGIPLMHEAVFWRTLGVDVG